MQKRTLTKGSITKYKRSKPAILVFAFAERVGSALLECGVVENHSCVPWIAEGRSTEPMPNKTMNLSFDPTSERRLRPQPDAASIAGYCGC